MKAEHVDIIRLTSVKAMIMKKAKNTNEKQKWNKEEMIVINQMKIWQRQWYNREWVWIELEEKK